MGTGGSICDFIISGYLAYVNRNLRSPIVTKVNHSALGLPVHLPVEAHDLPVQKVWETAACKISHANSRLTMAFQATVETSIFLRHLNGLFRFSSYVILLGHLRSHHLSLFNL